MDKIGKSKDAESVPLLPLENQIENSEGESTFVHQTNDSGAPNQIARLEPERGSTYTSLAIVVHPDTESPADQEPENQGESAYDRQENESDITDLNGWRTYAEQNRWACFSVFMLSLLLPGRKEAPSTNYRLFQIMGMIYMLMIPLSYICEAATEIRPITTRTLAATKITACLMTAIYGFLMVIFFYDAITSFPSV